MRAILNILPGISLQTEMPVGQKNIALLEGTILLPAICIIMILVVVAGIAITVQKHKRY